MIQQSLVASDNENSNIIPWLLSMRAHRLSQHTFSTHASEEQD
jgi:hypothetical protein